MTILDFSSSSSIGNKNCSLLSLALKKPIAKKDSKKHQQARYIDSSLLKSSFNLVNKRNLEQKASKVPINSAYHKINWQWTSASESLLISKDSKSVCIHSDCQSCFETEAVRGDTPLKRKAFTYWEVSILNDNLNGTSIQIGLGNKNANTKAFGYLNLLGSDSNSYGLSHDGRTWHGNQTNQFCSTWNESQVKIGCLFNGFTGKLSFFKNGAPLGVAFENIDMTNDLFPMVSSTAVQSAFRFECVYESFPSLMDMCRKAVLKNHIELSKEAVPMSVLNFLRN